MARLFRTGCRRRNRRGGSLPAGSGRRSIGEERPKSPPRLIWPCSSSPYSDGAAAAAAVQDRQLAAETLQHHLGRVLLDPLWSCHLRVCSWPSMYTFEPFFRYCSATRPRFSLKITTECHSVFSLRSPGALVLPGLGRGNAQVHHRLPVVSRRTSGPAPDCPPISPCSHCQPWRPLHFISPERPRHRGRPRFQVGCTLLPMAGITYCSIFVPRETQEPGLAAKLRCELEPVDRDWS